MVALNKKNVCSNSATQQLLNALDERFIISGFAEQQDDDYPPVRGFVRSSFSPIFYHAALKAGQNAQLDQLPATKKAIISASMFLDGVSDEQSNSDLLAGKRVSPILFPQSVPSSVVGIIAKELTINGPMTCISASSGSVISMLQQAYDWLDDGDANAVLLVCGDVPSLRANAWFDLHAMSEAIKHREFKGVANAVVIEKCDHAQERGISAQMSVTQYYQHLQTSDVVSAWQSSTGEQCWYKEQCCLSQLHNNHTDGAAILHGGNSLSYKCLNDNVASKQTSLETHNICNARVAIDLPDSTTLLEWVLACWRQGNTVFILDPRLCEQDKQERLKKFRPNAIVCSLNKEKSAAAAFEFSVNTDLNVIEAVDRATQQSNIQPNDIALVQFSSGSTGRQKMICRSYQSLNTEWHNYHTEPGSPNSHSRVLCLVPISHSYGLLTATLATLSCGGQVFFPPLIHPRVIVETIVEQQISHVYGVPFHFQLLIETLKQQKETLPKNLTLLSSGGKLSQGIVDSYQTQLGFNIGEQYGMSEVGYIANDFYARKPGSVGKIASHIRYRLSNNKELIVHLNQSPYTESHANWQPHSEDDQTGELFTQDIVEIDDDGYIFVQGRVNDQVSIGGLKVNLSEIETALKAIDSVNDGCVVAHQHSTMGAVLEAFVVTENEDTSKEAIIAELADNLAAYKVPRTMTFVTEIPKSGSGKVLKGKLLEAKT